MATQGRVEGGPGSVDPRLLSIQLDTRVNYGLEIFQGLVRSDERFGLVLNRLGYNPLQAPFVTKTAELILNGEGSAEGLAVVFRPDNDKERGEGGRHARVYSPRAGVAELTAYFPTDERVIAGGLVYWKVVKIDEARALEPLFDGKRPLLRLVAMDPSILQEDALRPFIEATHSDEPNLKPKTFMRSIVSRFRGDPLYEVFMRGGKVMVDRYEKGEFKKTEYWVTFPPLEGEGFLLVGKEANPKVA